MVRLKSGVFSWLDKRPIAEIDAPEILAVLKRIDTRRTGAFGFLRRCS
ncbi:phage integrase central domain-containing protein [Burkholderia perseverans]|nr:hypothetical protein [Burkholderia perseverans]